VLAARSQGQTGEGAAEGSLPDTSHLEPDTSSSTIHPTKPNPFDQITELVVNSVHSEHSQRAYRRAIESFIAWYQTQPGRPPLSKAMVHQYRVTLTEAKLAPSTINVQLSAIRRLATEAADNRLLDADLAAGIAKVRGVKNTGVRAGNWLTREQARELLLAPDTSTLKGKRDRAILAVLMGCGLRRSELVALELRQIEPRENRWVIVDFRGKGGRKRTVPVPAWVKNAIDAWASAAEITEGPIFRSIGKGGRLKDAPLAQVGVWWLVKEYADRIGLKNLAPKIFGERVRNYAGSQAGTSSKSKCCSATRRSRLPRNTLACSRT
jgi:site-specific recombinase XerD